MDFFFRLGTMKPTKINFDDSDNTGKDISVW